MVEIAKKNKLRPALGIEIRDPLQKGDACISSDGIIHIPPYFFEEDSVMATYVEDEILHEVLHWNFPKWSEKRVRMECKKRGYYSF